MSISKGLKMWIMTELEYDEYGKATVIRSYAKPSADSSIKQAAKKARFAKKKKAATSTERSEVDLF